MIERLNHSQNAAIARFYDLQWNPDNSNFQGKSKKVPVIEGKISKKITWRGIEKGSS